MDSYAAETNHWGDDWVAKRKRKPRQSLSLSLTHKTNSTKHNTHSHTTTKTEHNTLKHNKTQTQQKESTKHAYTKLNTTKNKTRIHKVKHNQKVIKHITKHSIVTKFKHTQKEAQIKNKNLRIFTNPRERESNAET